jgi:membrane protein required for colicin V production
MTGLDIIALLVVAIAAVGGFMRGFVQEVLSLAAWILAIFAIRYLHTDLTAFLAQYIGTSTSAALLAFALLLLIPYVAMKLIAGRLGKASRNSIIGPFDRVLGFGFGAVKGLIIVVVAFSVLVLGYDTAWGPGGRPNWIKNARTYPFINAASEAMVQLIEMRRERLEEEDAVVRSAR